MTHLPERLGVAIFCAAMLLLAFVRPLAAQVVYTSGQNIAPVFEGWEPNPDGSFNMVFGFFNRNCEEVLHIPIGPENAIEPGGPDQGQPTRFFPRRGKFIFRVPVPSDFGDRELVWMLTAYGKTERAYASLRPQYILDKRIRMMNEAGFGQQSGEGDNLHPVLSIDGAMHRTVKVGEPLRLTASVSDDGLPHPRHGQEGSSATGLMAGWFVYRGDDAYVSLDPPQFNPDFRVRMRGLPPCTVVPPSPEDAKAALVSDGTAVVTATFSEPGTYVLRVMAHDGALKVTREITVNVTGG